MDRDHDDRLHMRRALRLAACSLGATWPNPGVGCVIVAAGTVIGQGRHRCCGGPHAEIEALDDCRRCNHDPCGATVYITLAPCTRHGRTPPCTEALIRAGVARVVVALADPVQDDAAAILGDAGIAYTSGCEAALARRVHGGFLTRVTSGRPRLTGKWAMTLDGSLAAHTGHSAWISSPQALAASRRRRRAFDAIVVGEHTASYDDPRLLATACDERTPVRVVLSPSADLPVDSALIASIDRAPVLVVHDAQAQHRARAALAAAGVELVAVTDVCDPMAVAAALGAYGFNEILVEGGATVHGAYLRAGIYDRLEVYQAGRSIGGGTPVARGTGVDRIDLATAWSLEDEPRIYGHTVVTRWQRCIAPPHEEHEGAGNTLP